MAVRIRQNGKIVCAAMHVAEPGDTYLNDGLHYRLSAELHVLVTDDRHHEHGEWWWSNEVPAGIKVDKWWDIMLEFTLFNDGLGDRRTRKVHINPAAVASVEETEIAPFDAFYQPVAIIRLVTGEKHIVYDHGRKTAVAIQGTMQ